MYGNQTKLTVYIVYNIYNIIDFHNIEFSRLLNYYIILILISFSRDNQ